MYHVFGYPYYKSQSTFDKKYAQKPEISRGVEFFVDFVKKRNPKKLTEKLKFRKYDPKARQHVDFVEKKIK
jgi:large subunit ribosomal protein L33